MRLKVSNVCQLLDKSTFWSTTRNGIKVTNNGDGTFTVNGTATYDNWFLQPVFQFQTSNPGYHTYLLDIGQYSGNANAHGVVYFYDDNVDSSVALIGTQDSSAFIRKINGPIPGRGTIIQARFAIVVFKGVTVTNWTIRPQLFDLTEMYGAGNEPTTVAQFRQDFPNEMYEYSPVCWKKFRRLKYIANKEPVQLLNKSDFKTAVSNGVTATPNTTNGMWTISGAATASEYLQIGVYYPGTDFNIGDKLFLRNSNIDNSVYFPYAAWYDKDHKYLGEYDGMGVFSVTNPETAYIACYFTTRTVGDINVTTQVQLFNLTRMYGKGNEPTAAEFVAQYPGFDYPVNKYNYLTLNRGKYIANKEPVQLLDKSKYPATQTMHGVTFTNNGDGTITVNGTNNGEIYYSLEVLTSIPVGHKVIIDDGNSTLYFFGGMWTKDNVVIGTIRPRTIFTLPSNLARLNMLYFVRYNTGGVTYNNELSRPQLFDLTAMYGAGNEPTTVAQFRADFPNELYDYNPYNAITFR